MLITERCKAKIKGVLSCYDRVVIQGTFPSFCYAEGMTSYLKQRGIRIFDYPKFAEPFREQIRLNAEAVAQKNGIKIEIIRRVNSFREDDRIQDILAQRGTAPGLVHIFSAMEAYPAYKPWHDKKTHKTFLKPDLGKCPHYYFYFIDVSLGLCYIRVPTWAPFRLQCYFNGHGRLTSALKKNGIAYRLQENAFVEMADWSEAQKLSDTFSIEPLHKSLDRFAALYCPVVRTLGAPYHWSVMQVEYATDIVFNKAEDLCVLYDTLVRTAVHAVKADNIATHRYLAFLSDMDDPTISVKALNKISEPEDINGRSYKGFNFFRAEDQTLFEILCRGEFNISGFRDKTLRRLLGRTTAQICFAIKRLWSNGLIRKIGKSCKYHLTAFGRHIALVGLKLKELYVIPNLAHSLSS